MARFIHTADWQIGRSFAGYGEGASGLLYEERFLVVERIAKLAAKEKIGLVLVAGDVFENRPPSNQDLRRLFGILGQSGPTWLLLPGNHDHAGAGGPWERARELDLVPGNARVLDSPGPVILEDHGLVVLPAPLRTRQPQYDVTEEAFAHATGESLIRVGVAHGSVTGVLPEGADATNPIEARRAASANLDYLALGDWHGSLRIDERTWYSGTPETDRFRNNQSGQVLLVDIPGPGAVPTVTAMPTGRFRWHELRPTLNVDSDVDRSGQELAGYGIDDLVKVTFSGSLSLRARETLDHLREEMEARVRYLAWDAGDVETKVEADDLDSLSLSPLARAILEELESRRGEVTEAVFTEAVVALVSLDRELS